jgi:hypothetical protein
MARVALTSAALALAVGVTGCISNSIGQLPGTVAPGAYIGGFSVGFVDSSPSGRAGGLMPEVSFTYVVSGDSPAGNALDAGVTLLQLSLTCLVGPSEPKQPAQRAD